MGTLKLPRKLTMLDVVDVAYTDARGRRRTQTCEVKDLEEFKTRFATHRAPGGRRNVRLRRATTPETSNKLWVEQPIDLNDKLFFT